MNNLTVIGNISTDLELKSTQSGKNVCSFNIAVKRPFTKDITDFFTVVCWNKQAENVCKYCYKGAKIGVSGMLTTRSYQDRDGNNRTVYEILANEVEFLAKNADGQSNSVSRPSAPANTFEADADGFVVADISEDDLPF